MHMADYHFQALTSEIHQLIVTYESVQNSKCYTDISTMYMYRVKQK